MDKEIGREIGRIDKNSQEKIVVRLTEFKDHKLCDIRVWRNNSGQDIPTHKGLAFSRKLMRELGEILLREAEPAGDAEKPAV